MFVDNNVEHQHQLISKILSVAGNLALKSPSKEIHIYKVFPGPRSPGFQFVAFVTKKQTYVFKESSAYDEWKKERTESTAEAGRSDNSDGNRGNSM